MVQQVGTPVGNVIGNPRAQTDKKMLSQAFLKTSDFDALLTRTDFNFVVGRRGTGKSALFEKLQEEFSNDKKCLLICATPEEYQMLSLRSIAGNSSLEYDKLKACFRVVWRISVLLEILKHVRLNYKYKSMRYSEELSAYYEKWKKFSEEHIWENVHALITNRNGISNITLDTPGELARQFDVEKILRKTDECISELGLRAVVMMDGLDEGWVPDEQATGIMGGLFSAISDIAEKCTAIHACIFSRDNMFRAIAFFDSDFSRNIEGNTLRLTWNQESLLGIVASRLRIALNMKDESDTKIWNRFAQKGLSHRQGFDLCLQRTLYRPRDIISLLNQAYTIAQRCDRLSIIEEDIEVSAKTISEDRLHDLIKEYDSVFPGLDAFVRIFRGSSPFMKVSKAHSILESMHSSDLLSEASGDFAIFGSAREVLFAMYSVGFFGIRSGDGSLQFCHDGSKASLDTLSDEAEIVIHPCYWRGLGVSEVDGNQTPLVINLDDDYSSGATKEVGDSRTRHLGQAIESLDGIELGPKGAAEFEKWAHRAISIVFAPHLQNVSLNPHPTGVEKRDIVATNYGQGGFWGRILEDYEVRQVVFEVKNYEDLQADDFRQVLSYASGSYGKLVFIVTRNGSEIPNSRAKQQVLNLYHTHKVIAFILPAVMLKTFLKKARSPTKKNTYVETRMGKELDNYERKYLSITQAQRNKKGA